MISTVRCYHRSSKVTTRYPSDGKEAKMTEHQSIQAGARTSDCRAAHVDHTRAAAAGPWWCSGRRGAVSTTNNVRHWEGSSTTAASGIRKLLRGRPADTNRRSRRQPRLCQCSAQREYPPSKASWRCTIGCSASQALGRPLIRRNSSTGDTSPPHYENAPTADGCPVQGILRAMV